MKISHSFVSCGWNSSRKSVTIISYTTKPSNVCQNTCGDVERYALAFARTHTQKQKCLYHSCNYYYFVWSLKSYYYGTLVTPPHIDYRCTHAKGNQTRLCTFHKEILTFWFLWQNFGYNLCLIKVWKTLKYHFNNMNEMRNENSCFVTYVQYIDKNHPT